MCMSMDELRSGRLEEILEEMRHDYDTAVTNDDEWGVRYYGRRIPEIEKLLKERADSGTYATAGI